MECQVIKFPFLMVIMIFVSISQHGLYSCENILSPVNGGVDAKELFNRYITLWIQDKRHDLLEFCKQDKVSTLLLVIPLSYRTGNKNKVQPFSVGLLEKSS